MNTSEYIAQIERDESKYDWNCSGKELIDIVNCLRPAIDNCIWFGADLDSDGNNIALEKWMSTSPCEIGTSDKLITLAKTTDQFLGGVFLLMPKGKPPSGEGFYTYNYYYRNLEDIILEIRAFDTTNYLLFSQNRTLLEMVATRFNSQIKTKKEYEDEVGYISAKEEFKNSKRSRALL